jgi:tRNA modification GTPase
MFSHDDTIVAIATAPGRAGLGVVRISGPHVPAIAERLLECRPLAPRHATFTTVRRAPGASQAVDEIVATWFPAPRSYTGEHVVELSAHGSPVVLEAIVQAVIDAGARLARPGEFTLRAFLNGKIDLVQAEAVADLIAASTPLQARVAFAQLEGTLTTRMSELDDALLDVIARLEASLDFPDEGYHFIEPHDVGAQLSALMARLDSMLADARRGRIIRDGATVVITGRPNVGKSSLFNALVGHDRAIVTATAGTTRDLVSETIDVDGIAIRLIDTAGLREARDEAEREGVSRSVRARDVADVVLVVLDRSEPLACDDHELLEATAQQQRIVVANKSDRAAAFEADDAVLVSATTGEGLSHVRVALARALTGDEALHDGAAISNVRHVGLLEQARAHLARACEGLRSTAIPEEFVLADLREARSCFDEIVGARANDEVLHHIFERFCIGK